MTLGSSSGSTPPPGTIQWSGRRDDVTSSTCTAYTQAMQRWHGGIARQIKKTPTTHRLTVMSVTECASVPRHYAMKVQEFQTSVITGTDTPRPKRGLGVLGNTAGCAKRVT